MDRERLAWLRLAAGLSDGLTLTVTWVIAVFLRSAVNEGGSVDRWPAIASLFPFLEPSRYLPLAAFLVPLWLVVLYHRGSYHHLRRKSAAQLGYELIGVAIVATLVVLAALYLVQADVSRTAIVGHAALSLPALVLTRVGQLTLLRRLRRRRFDLHQVALLGSPETAKPLIEVITRHPEWGMEVLGRIPLSAEEGHSAEIVGLPTLGTLDELPRLLFELPIDEVYLSTPRLNLDTLQTIAHQCEELGVRLSMDANFLGLRTASADLTDLDGWSVLTFSCTPTAGLNLAVKRLVDMAGAALGLLALSPLLTAVALAIKLQDGGPVLFVQQRVGRYGRQFPMYKFRTMIVDAEKVRADLAAQNEMSGPVFKMTVDPRVTRIGNFLRRSSIDELPQLVNVLLGHMSLVGPRPGLMEEVRRYERWQVRRLSMRPGITCIWQVSGRNNIDFERWMALDLEYIDNWSLWLDLSLLVRTVPAVVRGTGAR